MISAVLITLNEARNLGRCLASLRGVADEVIVVDSGSTDGTQEMARSLGARVVDQPWLGYGPQKNAGHDLAAGEYVLSIDADEEMSEELRQAILFQKEHGLQGAYAINRLNFFYGKAARHGLEYPDWKIRLYPRASHWNEAAVHEELLLPEGTAVSRLPGYLNHYTYRTLQEHLDKTIRYGRLAANEIKARGKHVPASKLILSPVSIFFKSFILKGGFRGGAHGLTLALMSAFGKFVKYALAREGQGGQDRAL